MVKQKQLKEAVDIEKLLQWAYLEELPKLKLSAAEGIWDRLAQYGSLGGVSPDASRMWGSGAQRYAQFGLPHPDALEIEKVVGALKPASVEDDFDVIVGELGALVSVNEFQPRKAIRVEGRAVEGGGYYEGTPPPLPPRDVILVRTINVAVLVTFHAVMRTRPDWTSAQPHPYQTPAARGPKIVGECRGKNLYTAGSYCPLRWSPSPIEVVLGRADYHLWRQALVRLAETLELEEHAALPPAASAAPWFEPEKTPHLWSYAVARQRPLPLRPVRDRAGSTTKKPRHSKVRSVLVDKGAKA